MDTRKSRQGSGELKLETAWDKLTLAYMLYVCCSCVYAAVSLTAIMNGHTRMPTTLLHQACVWRLAPTALPKPYKDSAQITPKLSTHCKHFASRTVPAAYPTVCGKRFSELQVFHVRFHMSSGESMAIWAATRSGGHSRSAMMHRSSWS